MKNFRKVLALVLVVATLFSFTAMTSAAYEDADKVSYKEAVDVLSAVGILNGYEVAEDEYEFKPTQTISREEMAKMIAVLANAGDDVSTLYASASTFADVAKDRWSASYVAYCAKTGIVAGRSASTFDPTGKVTGLETAKMLLVVLGFDADEQGYVGADWKVNVLRDAKVMGLTNNFAADYDIDAAITREEAAQMMLNALEAPCVVGIVSDGIVTMTNALVVNWKGLSGDWTEKIESLLSVTAYAKLKDAMDAGQWCLYGNVLISNDPLAYRLYGLQKITTNEKNDCYMRPGTGWKWVDAKGNVETYASYADAPVFAEYNTSKNAVSKFLKTYNLDKYTVTYYVDGVKDTDSSDDEYYTTGNGALIEIYVVGTELRVVQINTYIGKILDVDTYHKTVTVGTTNVAEHTAKNTFGLTTKDEGKVALYWQCAGKHDKAGYDLHAVELATPVVAKVTKAVKDNANGGNYFIASGDKYEYAVNFNRTINLDGNVFGEVVDGANYGVGKEWKIYTDKYGYVMAYEPATKTEYKYAVIDHNSLFEVYEGLKQDGTKVYSYTGALVEFEAEPAVGDKLAFDSSVWHKVNAYLADEAGKHDALVKYYIDADGEVAVALKDGALAEPATKASSWSDLQAKGVVTVDDVLVTENTEILLRVTNPMTGKDEYKYFEGIDEVDAIYDLDHVQYYTNTAETKATYMYAEAKYATVSAFAYFLGEAESVVYLTDGNKVVGYNTYAAIVDGEEAIIATDAQIVKELEVVYELVAERIGLTTDDNKPVYLVEKEKLHIMNDSVKATIDAADGYITIEGAEPKRLDGNAKFVVVFTDGWGDEDFEVMTAAEIVEYTSNWAHVYVWAKDADADKDVDLVYVNAECGIDNCTDEIHG